MTQEHLTSQHARPRHPSTAPWRRIHLGLLHSHLSGNSRQQDHLPQAAASSSQGNQSSGVVIHFLLTSHNLLACGDLPADLLWYITVISMLGSSKLSTVLQAQRHKHKEERANPFSQPAAYVFADLTRGAVDVRHHKSTLLPHRPFWQSSF